MLLYLTIIQDTKELFAKIGDEFDINDDSPINRQIGANTLYGGFRSNNANVVKQIQNAFNQFVSDCANGDVRTCSK